MIDPSVPRGAEPDPPPSSGDAALAAVRARVREQRERYVEALASLVRIPSVSTDVPECRAAARFVAETAAARGLRVRCDEVPEAGPVVFAEGPARPGAPSLIGYAHYDVKPAGDRTAWRHDPWGAAIEGGRMYGRGVVDNKSGALALIFAAEACAAVDTPPVNIKLIIEGEEEIGSPHLEEWARAHADDVEGAAGIFCLDGSTEPPRGLPRVDLFGRGILYVQLTVETATVDVHSHKAVLVRDAAWRLIEALRTIKDVETDRVIVPGWGDELLVPTDADWEYFREKAAVLDPAALRAQHGTLHDGFPAGRAGVELVRAYYMEPTCTICGLWAGETTPGVRMTAVPRRAVAKLDFRCPPHLNAARQAEKLRAHLDRAGFGDVRMEVLSARAPTWHTSSRSELVGAIRRAGVDAFGGRWVAEAGRPSAEGVFSDGFGIPPVLTGFANPDCAIHAADENLVLEHYFRGIEYAAAIFVRFGETAAAPGRTDRRAADGSRGA